MYESMNIYICVCVCVPQVLECFFVSYFFILKLKLHSFYIIYFYMKVKSRKKKKVNAASDVYDVFNPSEILLQYIPIYTKPSHS